MGWKIKDARAGDVVYFMGDRGVAKCDGHKGGYGYWCVWIVCNKKREVGYSCRCRCYYEFTESDIRKNAFFQRFPSGQDRLFMKMEGL